MPGEHYVPVEFDFSNLDAQLDWARANDDDARRIATAATAFVRERLRPEDVACYVYRLLVEYAARQETGVV